MEIKLICLVYKMDELMKRGGRTQKQKQKQKQSVVIKNVINIGERKKKMNKRQKRARTQQQAKQTQQQQAQPFIPQAQYPLQRLFQPQQQIYRSVSMSSANASEANNNTSKVIDATQKISSGKVNAEIDNNLEDKPYRRLLDELNGVSMEQQQKLRDLSNDDDDERKSPIRVPIKKDEYAVMSPLELSPFSPMIPNTIFNPATGKHIKNNSKNRKKIENMKRD